MKAMIVGCGRVGAALADRLSSAGHEVTILDTSTGAFNRLSPGFAGRSLRGDGTDEDVLRRAGLAGSDLFVALTEGDNRNVLMSQLARETFAVTTVIAKVNDPVRAEAYSSLGLATICRTTILADAIAEYLGDPAGRPRGVQPPTGHDHPLQAAPSVATANQGG